MKEKEINGIKYDVYTYEDWCNDGDLSVKVGQLIDPRVYFQLLNSLPPKQNGIYFQCGEPDSHDWNTGKALYKTYESMGEHYYKYIGLKI